MRGSVTSATAQGLRPEQEDRYAVVRVDEDRGRWLLAVFDGHNGAQTAEIAAGLVPEVFDRTLTRYGDAKAAIEATIGVLGAETADRSEGSSVSLAYVDGDAGRAVIGVLGDSPVLVRDASGSCVLGALHNTIVNPEDAARAVARGAMMIGPYLCDPQTLEGVNLTRTIGDAELAFLGRAPEMLDAELGPRSFVLVASDGLFSFASPSPDALVERAARLVDEGAGAEDIVADALANGSDDNVTVVLWRASSASGNPEMSSPAPAPKPPGGAPPG